MDDSSIGKGFLNLLIRSYQMNKLNETATPADANVSELEMVGALLFGSISGETSKTAEVVRPSGENRMVNLGAQIAPENTRQWEAEEPEVVLTSRDSEIISAILPEKKNPIPVHESRSDASLTERTAANESEEPRTIQAISSRPAPVAASRKLSIRPASVFYGGVLVLLTLCVVFLGWQVYSDEKTVVSAEEKTQVEAAVEAVAAAEPKVETATVPVVEAVPESGFASAESANSNFDAPIPAVELAQEEYPTFNSSLGGAMNREIPAIESVPTGMPIGSAAVVEEESYPTFNANLGAQEAVFAVSSPAPTQVYAQNPAVPAGNFNTVPRSEWNVGAAMEEVPVFNSEMSNFNAQPIQNAYAQQTPQVAPMNPQIGSQATVASTVSTAPRKLTPPNASRMNDVPAANETEAYPSFNPEIGVGNALPVRYY